jgi:hypothetical protein
MKQSVYTFDDEYSAIRFVIVCAKSDRGFAMFRHGTRVTVLDPTGMNLRDIFRFARECGGSPE